MNDLEGWTIYEPHAPARIRDEVVFSRLFLLGRSKLPLSRSSATAMLSHGQVHQADEQHKYRCAPLEKLAVGQIEPDWQHDFSRQRCAAVG